MAVLPHKVSNAWDERKGPVVLSTSDTTGVPNAIYASSVRKFDEETIIIADNYFDKTRKNILAGSKGSVLFITDDGAAFQVKGTIELHTEGVFFDDMKKWNKPELPGRAAGVLKVEEVYEGAEKLL